MSAWIVSKNHIDTLVYWGVRSGLIKEDNRDAFGRMLWETNLESVAYLYPDDVSGDRPGPMGLTDEDISSYKYSDPVVIPATEHYDEGDPCHPVIAMVQLECYDYQSCEHPGYRGSEARSFYVSLRNALIEDEGVVVGASDRIPWGL